MKANKDVYVSDFNSPDEFYSFARLHGITVDPIWGIIYKNGEADIFGNRKLTPIGMDSWFSDPHYMFQFMLDAIKRNDRKMTKRIWRKPYLSRHLRYGKQQ